MTKTAKIEDRKFACVAEAVAHYSAQGFHTFDDSGDVRIMRQTIGHYQMQFDEVLISHNGLLDVSASHVRISI